VPESAGGLAIPRLRRPLIGIADIRSWLPRWSTAALLRAIRATVVIAGLFALTDKVIGNLQMATFAAFGGFATLVLTSFSGSRRDKLLAHTALALAGSALLTIGTAISSSTAIAAIVTVPVTFLVFFAGVAGPNAASGVTGALLAYVLPAASTGTMAVVPDRLAGWWLASVAGTAAVLLLSPRAGADPLRGAAAKLAGALADELDGALRGLPPEPGLAASLDAKRELVTRFTATPYRPVGLNAPDQALANAIELLEWCTDLLADCIRERSDLRADSPPNRELLTASEAVLRDVATLLTGGDADPDLAGLERSRAQCLAWLSDLSPERADFARDEQLGFHADAIAVAVLAIGGDSLVASGKADPEWMEAERRRWFLGSKAGSRALRRVSSLATAARQDASVRSVWFLNSVRGAVALAVAVAVADLSTVQHGFWVVLGTLSVLRTNAASTGSTAIRGLGGTALGFVIGGALLVAIGSSSAVLWAALPIAVFVAAYTPGTAPFAIGQAAFTVTIAVLFNLLVPVGWSVGVVRIEDVAIGCAVSVLVGGLFWPRGLSAVVGDDLADAFRSGASYLTQAVGWASGREAIKPQSALASVTSASRLDDALRGFLAEQGSKRIQMRELWRLVGGSMRLRLTAHSITNLPRMAGGDGPLSEALDERVRTLASWYGGLADLVGKPHERTVPALSAPAFDHTEPAPGALESRYAIWLDEHLDHLSEHLAELVPPARRVAEVRRRPWWR
jgi:Fusaric acid resistance protein-like